MVKEQVKRVARDAGATAGRIADHPWFERVARAGFVANGLVHIILGCTAVWVAVGGKGDTEQSGAIKVLAQQPFGLVLLWLCLLGTALLALWNLFNAFFGTASLKAGGSADPREQEGRRRWKDFLKALGQAAAYAAVAAAFVGFVRGDASDSGRAASQASTTLASAPGGQVLLWLAGALLGVVGLGFCVNGVRRKWKDELRRPSSPAVASALTVCGVAGYFGKGITLAAVGVLAAVAAARGDSQDSTGVDGALKSMRELPMGVPLLVAVGLGLALYGVFLVLRSRYDTMK